MVEKRNARVLSLVHAPRGLKQTKFSKSVAAGGGGMGFRLVDRAKVVVNQIDGADREHDPQPKGQQRWYNEFPRNDYVALLDTGFVQSQGKKPPCAQVGV